MSKAFLCTGIIGAAALLGLIVPPGLAEQASSPNQKQLSGTNAAPRYWQAMTILDGALRQKPELDLNTFIDKETINTAKLEELRAFVESNQPIVKSFITASTIPDCDFVDNTLETDGPGALLPHLAPLRRGLRLLIADGLLKLNDGQGPQGAESLAAALRISRHTQNDEIMISSLVSLAMFHQVGTAMNWSLDRGVVGDAERKILAGALAAFSNDDPFAVRHSITRERDVFLNWIRREFAAGNDPKSQEFTDFMSLIGSTSQNAQAEVIRRAVEQGESIEPYIKLTEHFYDLTLQAWDAPDAAKQLEILGEQVNQGTYGPLTSLISPAWERAYNSNAKAIALLKSLRERVTL